MAINKWKIVAIIFIALFILETIIFYSVYSYGMKIKENEVACAVDVCHAGTEDNMYTGYYYNSENGICYCYDGLDVVLTRRIT